MKNCWSILNLKNPKDLFTGRKLELSLNLFKQAVETASALTSGKTIILGASPPHHLRVKTPSVHNQTVATEYTFSPVYSILTFSLTYLELVITWSEFIVNLWLPGPCNALQKIKNKSACWFVFRFRCGVFRVNYCFTYNPTVIHSLMAI